MARVRITVDAIVEIKNPSSVEAIEATLRDVVEKFVAEELLDVAAELSMDGRDARAFEAASEAGVERYSISVDRPLTRERAKVRKGPPAKGS